MRSEYKTKRNDETLPKPVAKEDVMSKNTSSHAQAIIILAIRTISLVTISNLGSASTSNPIEETLSPYCDTCS